MIQIHELFFHGLYRFMIFCIKYIRMKSTCMHAYTKTHTVFAYMHTHIQFLHTCMHKHTYIHYIHTYTHTPTMYSFCMHACIYNLAYTFMCMYCVHLMLNRFHDIKLCICNRSGLYLQSMIYCAWINENRN